MSSFIKTDDHLTVVFENGESATVYTTNSRYQDIVAAVRDKAWERVREMMIPSTAIKKQMEDVDAGTHRVEVKGGIVYLDDQPMHNTLTDRMVDMLNDGFNIEPMMRFLENLMDNPSYRAVNELYGFLEKSELPITEDGHFIAYKRVRGDYMDAYSGTIDNSIGAVCEMARNSVDEDASRTCSAGLHFCSREYLPHYGASGGHVMIVKINPRDVVAIPTDYNNAKGRTCRYEVVGELELAGQSSYEVPEEELEGSFRPDDKPAEDAPVSKTAIEQYNLDTNIVVAVFASASEAGRKTGIDSSSISKVARGQRKMAGGFGWRFLEEETVNTRQDVIDLEGLDDLDIDLDDDGDLEIPY